MKKMIYKISRVKIVFRNLNSYKNTRIKRNQKKYQSGFILDQQEIQYTAANQVFKDNDFLNRLNYKNEDWEVVKYRFHDRFLKFFYLPTRSLDNLCADNKTKIVENNLYFKSIGLKDDWIYFYLHDPSLKNYTLYLEAIFHSHFREIQFGIRYVDFYNRYRFRIENNYLHFDIVRKGQFYNSLLAVPLQLDCDKNYKFNIVVKNEKYSFSCNSKVIMTVTDNLKLFKKGAVALILWDDSGESNIQGAFKNVQFNYIS